MTLHIPKTDETRNLLNAERLALMKKSAFLVNCARGGVVDEDALLKALENDELAGAAGEEVGEALQLLGEELKKGYDRIRNALSKS